VSGRSLHVGQSVLRLVDVSDGGDETDGADAAPSTWPVVLSAIAATLIAAGTATVVLVRKDGWAGRGLKVRARIPGSRSRD
jgi:hypothetical protein